MRIRRRLSVRAAVIALPVAALACQAFLGEGGNGNGAAQADGGGDGNVPDGTTSSDGAASDAAASDGGAPPDACGATPTCALDVDAGEVFNLTCLTSLCPESLAKAGLSVASPDGSLPGFALVDGSTLAVDLNCVDANCTAARLDWQGKKKLGSEVRIEAELSTIVDAAVADKVYTTLLHVAAPEQPSVQLVAQKPDGGSKLLYVALVINGDGGKQGSVSKAQGANVTMKVTPALVTLGVDGDEGNFNPGLTAVVPPRLSIGPLDNFNARGGVTVHIKSLRVFVN